MFYLEALTLHLVPMEMCKSTKLFTDGSTEKCKFMTHGANNARQCEVV